MAGEVPYYNDMVLFGESMLRAGNEVDLWCIEANVLGSNFDHLLQYLKKESGRCGNGNRNKCNLKY